MPLAGREYRLKKALEEVSDRYEFVVMDAPPSLGLLNLNALIAADDLFVPVLPDFLSFHGLKLLFETLSGLEDDLDHTLQRIFIVLNQYNPTTRIAREARGALENHYPEFLAEDASSASAPSSPRPPAKVCPSAPTIPRSKGAKDTNALIHEVLSAPLDRPAGEDAHDGWLRRERAGAQAAHADRQGAHGADLRAGGACLRAGVQLRVHGDHERLCGGHRSPTEESRTRAAPVDGPAPAEPETRGGPRAGPAQDASRLAAGRDRVASLRERLARAHARADRPVPSPSAPPRRSWRWSRTCGRAWTEAVQERSEMARALDETRRTLARAQAEVEKERKLRAAVEDRAEERARIAAEAVAEAEALAAERDQVLSELAEQRRLDDEQASLLAEAEAVLERRDEERAAAHRAGGAARTSSRRVAPRSWRWRAASKALRGARPARGALPGARGRGRGARRGARGARGARGFGQPAEHLRPRRSTTKRAWGGGRAAADQRSRPSLPSETRARGPGPSREDSTSRHWNFSPIPAPSSPSTPSPPPTSPLVAGSGMPWLCPG